MSQNNKDITYSDYLNLDKILNAHNPLSTSHDESLFIIIHQVQELWMQLLLKEIESSINEISKENYDLTFKVLTRISRIFEQMNNAWDVLRTLTTSEYKMIRKSLGTSSGFQSFQYRAIEFALGNKNQELLQMHSQDHENYAYLKKLYNSMTLYDHVIHIFSKMGLEIDNKVLNRDYTEIFTGDKSVQSAIIKIYQTPSNNWIAYYLCEKLLDLEDYFRRWRFNHIIAVERIIGSSVGTGGSSGTTYLKEVLNKCILFPDIWQAKSKI